MKLINDSNIALPQNLLVCINKKSKKRGRTPFSQNLFDCINDYNLQKRGRTPFFYAKYIKPFILFFVFLIITFIFSALYPLNLYAKTLTLPNTHPKNNIKNHIMPVSAASATAFKIINKNDKYINLKQVLKLALEHYPGILSSKYNYLNYVYLNNESTYQYYPQISAHAGFTKETVMDVNSTGAAQTIGNQVVIHNVNRNYFINYYSGSINATLMLYSFGSRYYNYLQSKYNMLSQKYSYNLTINNDLYNVIFNFESYFQDKQLEKANKENLKNDEMQYKAAYAFYKVGTGDLLDAETAKAAMEVAKASYINSTFNVKIAKLAIFNSMGIYPKSGTHYHFVNSVQFKPFRTKLNKLIANGLKHNPQLKQAFFTVKSSKASVNQAITGYYPSLNSNFSYTGENSSFPLNRNYAVGITISIPIFNGFLTENRVGAAKAQLNSNIENKQLIKNNLVYSVSQDYYNLINQYLTAKALHQSLKSSSLAYKLALKSYKVGVGSMVQLVTANAQYITSKTNYINTEFTYVYQKAKLYSDLGLLMHHYLK
ncbi:MAG: TolC family protein [bacterium]